MTIVAWITWIAVWSQRVALFLATWLTLWAHLPGWAQGWCWNTLAVAHTAVATLIQWVA